MKQVLLAAAMAATIVGFYACNNDEEISGNEAQNSTEAIDNDGCITFEFGIEEEITRLGRDLRCEAPYQYINDMKVYVFAYDGSSYRFTGDTFDASSLFTDDIDITTETQTYALGKDEKLEAGTYKFLAIGMDDKKVNTLLSNLTAGEDMKTFTLSFKEGMDAEVFSGLSDDVVITDAGALVKILLKRTVAGVLAYFKNVPLKVGDATVGKLQIVAAHQGDFVSLYDRKPFGEASKTDGYVLFEKDFSNESHNDLIYTCDAVTEGCPTKIANSWLTGSFMIPVFSHPSSDTFRVQLTDAEGNVLKTYRVSYDGTSKFGLERNYLYTMGHKLTDGSEALQRGVEKDEPINLFDEQNIQLTVSSDWCGIHDLTLTE